MLGRGILKIIGLAIAGAMALAGGAQLLSSVALVVISFRNGNIIPLIIAIGTTAALIQLKRLLAKHALSAILGILAYAASGYLAVVAFVGLLPYGMVPSLLGAALTIIVCSVMYDSSNLKEWMATLSPDSTISWLSRNPGTPELSISKQVSDHIALLPPESRENVIMLMRDRPLLPISLTHFNECDVLFIEIKSERASLNQIRDTLLRASVAIKNDASPLLREAILKVPLIDEKHGLSMAEYCLATDQDTVNHLIRNPPSRMFVFPSRTGPRVIYPESAAPGLISQRVPERELVNALLLHRYTNLKEANDTFANST
ncbi:MAG: hypothetical protein ACFFAD_06630 [Candidatus Hermodarchaeota archaeon]